MKPWVRITCVVALAVIFTAFNVAIWLLVLR